jgi:hypothetical protein
MKDLNLSSHGVNCNCMKSRGITTLGRRDKNGVAEVFEHPDGHPDLVGDDQPAHHEIPHVHATNTKGAVIVFTYPAGRKGI